jgi:hypothetical protein
LDTVEALEPVVHVGGEWVGAVWFGVLDTYLGGFERVEPRGDLGSGGFGESGGGDESADTKDRAERCEECPDGTLGNGSGSLADAVAQSQVRASPMFTHPRWQAR